MNDLKKLAIRVMIGSLIAAAGLAVVSVLVGEFNDMFARALGTIGIVTVHALACIGYADNMEKSKNKMGIGLGFFQNSMLALIILSFFTAVFGIWELLPGSIVGKLYLTYGVIAFASLHGSALAETTGKTRTIDNLVYANYLFMLVVVFMLLMLVWFMGAEFGDFYYRLLAACGIVDATLTILAIILHRLYLQKHPEEKSMLFAVTATQQDAQGNPTQLKMAPPRRMNPLLWLLGLFIVAQVVLSIVGMIIGSISR